SRVKKVLRAKYWAGLNKPQKIDTHRLVDRINHPAANALIEQLYASSISVITNKNDFLPLKNIELMRMASVTIGAGGNSFKAQLNKYGSFTHFNLNKGS